MTDNTTKRKVLLTGAAGRIATAFRHYDGERYALRLADRDLGRIGDSAGHEAVALEIADLDACQAACAGIDTVVHLAADPSPDADFYGSLLDNNIKGTYNVFRAARDQGCRRVIFASSVHAVIGYMPDVQAHPEFARSPDQYVWREQVLRRGGRPLLRRFRGPLQHRHPHRRLRGRLGQK